MFLPMDLASKLLIKTFLFLSHHSFLPEKRYRLEAKYVKSKARIKNKLTQTSTAKSLSMFNGWHQVLRRNYCYVNEAPDILFLFHRQSSSSVIRSNSPTTTSQIMARKKRRGVCDFFSFYFMLCSLMCSSCFFFHHE